MAVGIRPLALFVIAALGIVGPSPQSGFAQTIDCTTLPPPDPGKKFLQNFLNGCYAFPLHAAKGSGNSMTDLDQTYAGFFYRVDPRYELILLGEFPRARYLSIKVDDGHYSTQEWLYDAQIEPLASQFVNPFTPGVMFKEDQLYAVSISFGGTQPLPEAVSPGCDLGPVNFHQNVLDATKRHEGISWNGKPDAPPWFPPHDDTGPNRGGLLTVRQYMNEADGGNLRFAIPVLIARDLTTGCAVPVAQILATESSPPDTGLITGTESVAANWMDLQQTLVHQHYRTLQRPACYAYTPSMALWFKPEAYLELPNPDAGYVLARVPPGYVNWLVENREFMRIRFRLPTMPSIPCDSCSTTGDEELRYFSLSFIDNGKKTIASLGEFELARDPAGYVTVIVGFGSAPPAHVTAENYYAYLDLSAVENYQHLTTLAVRMILANPNFQCSANAVSTFTSEDNSLGGVMGEYAPVADVVRGSSLPTVAEPLQHPNSCGQTPPEPPAACPF